MVDLDVLNSTVLIKKIFEIIAKHSIYYSAKVLM